MKQNTILFVCVLLFYSACENVENDLIGTWRSEDIATQLTFWEDYTYSQYVDTPAGAQGPEQAGKWEVSTQDGKKIIHLTESQKQIENVPAAVILTAEMEIIRLSEQEMVLDYGFGLRATFSRIP